jgi:energy-coupling factor transporter ATP-binding protein EcfA2
VLFRSNQSYFITGPGGSGKTTLLKQIQSILTKQDKKHITLCPTNLAVLLVDGMTIHKFSTKLKKQSQVESLDLDYIFIDEVSMLGEVFYKFLMMIKKIKPEIKYIISGDYNQLKPVNDRISQYTDYSNAPCLFELADFIGATVKSDRINFVMVDAYSDQQGAVSLDLVQQAAHDKTVVFCLSSQNANAMQSVRRLLVDFAELGINQPIILVTDSSMQTPDEHLIHFATETGALLLEGFGDGISLGYRGEVKLENPQVNGRTYLPVKDIYQFTNNTAFSILQATRTRISKTEYISCPSCGRTLFDLQETTAKIRSVTNHLKGVKIAIMGCIVNGPGEMADADFGYVGSGPGKITLYRNKDVVKKNVDSEVAVDELINLLKESGAWVEPA